MLNAKKMWRASGTAYTWHTTAEVDDGCMYPSCLQTEAGLHAGPYGMLPYPM